MQKFSHGKKRLERLQYKLSVAGNGLFLAGSILYVTETAVAGTWAFVVGSGLALASSLLPQLIQAWFCPAEEDPEASSRDLEPVPLPLAAAPVAA